MDALSAGTAGEAADALEGLPIDAYNPFNLLVADAHSAHVVTYEGRPSRIDLPPGAHVIGNVHPEDDTFPKVVRQRERVAEAAAGPEEGVLDALSGICGSHEGDGPIEHTCVHAGEYGTRSSTLLRVGGDDAFLHYADGPPCRSEYRDYTHLLAELDLGSPRPAHPSMRKVS